MSEQKTPNLWKSVGYSHPGRFGEYYVGFLSGAIKLAQYHSDHGWEDFFGRIVRPDYWWNGPGQPNVLPVQESPLEELYGPGEKPPERPFQNCFEDCPLGRKQPDWDKIHQYVEDMLDNLVKIEEEMEEIR